MPTLKEIYEQDMGRAPQDFSQSPSIDRSYLDANYVRPTSLTEQKDIEDEREANQPRWWETVSDAFQSDTSIGALSRYSDRGHTDIDLDFKIGDERMQELVAQYSDREIEYLTASMSETDLVSRKQDIEQDRERERRLSEAGGFGTVSRLALSILDPANIALAAISGPIGGAARVSRLANAVRGAGITAAENVALDAVLTSADTQRNWDDLVISAAAGGILGGAVGSLRRIKAEGTPQESAISNLERLDKGLADAADERDMFELRDIITQRSVMEDDVDHINAAVVKRDIELANAGAKRPLSSKSVKGKEKRIKEHSQRIVENMKQEEIEINDVRSKHGLTKKDLSRTGKKGKVARLQAMGEIDNIRARFDALNSELHGKIEDLTEQLSRNNKNMEDFTELQRWKELTPEQKIKELYPEGRPQIEKIIEETKRVQVPIHQANTKAIDDAIEKYKPKTETETDTRPETDRSAGAAEFNPEMVNKRFSIKSSETDRDFVEQMIRASEDYEYDVNPNFVKGIPDYMLGDYSIITQHDSPAVKALANLFLSNPQTGKYGETIANLVRLFDADIRRAGKAAIDQGFDQHLKELGVGKVNGYISPSYREHFETQVALAIKGLIPDANISEGVRTAAKGVADQLRAAGELRKGYGEVGFENIELGGNYLPDIMSREGLSHLFYGLGWEREDIVDLISKGYAQGANDITEKQARLMGHIKYNSWEKGQLYDGDVFEVYRATSIAEAERLLKEANVPKELMDDFLEQMHSKEDIATMSNRARKSLHIDWSATHSVNGKQVAISDIMNTNVSQILEAYTKESAYGAALAKKGIKSEAQRKRIFLQVKEQAKGELGMSEVGAKEIDKIFDRFDKAITQLQGRPLVDYTQASNRAGRMVLDMTSILRLQQAGFASIGDLARTIATAGIGEVVRAVPSANVFRNPFNRMSGRTVGEFKSLNEDMQEIEYMLGFFEEDNFHHSFTSRSEEFGSDARSRIGKALENSLEGTKRIGQWMNLFNTVQGSISKISAKAVNRRLIKDALGKEALSNSLRKELLDTGITEQDWSDISKWVKENHITSRNDIPLWNIEKMPGDMRMKLRLAMSKIHMRNVQRGIAGETNSDWFGPYARFFTQFKSHSLISLEKQIVHDMRGDKAHMAGVTMWGMGLAYAAYMSQMNLRALGMSEDERQDYLDKNTTGKALAWGVLNKHSQLASIGLLSDLGMFSGALPAEMYDTTRYGYQHGRLDSLVPAMGVIQDAAKTTGNAFELMYSPMTGQDPAEAAQELTKGVFRNLPYLNTIYFGEFIKNQADID